MFDAVKSGRMHVLPYGLAAVAALASQACSSDEAQSTPGDCATESLEVMLDDEAWNGRTVREVLASYTGSTGRGGSSGAGGSGNAGSGGTSSGEPPALAGILAAHNAVRAAKGIAPLTWDPALAAIAQRWVEQCVDNDGQGLVDHNAGRSEGYPTSAAANSNF